MQYSHYSCIDQCSKLPVKCVSITDSGVIIHVGLRNMVGSILHTVGLTWGIS